MSETTVGTEKLWEKIKDIKFGMLTVIGEDGVLASRPLTTQQTEFDGVLWFLVSKHPSWVPFLQRDDRVNMSYAEPNDSLFVSVSGTARVVDDRAMLAKLWTPMAKAWFPLGLNDPELALLKLDVVRGEYWDSRSTKMVQLYILAKAVLSGTQPTDLGEHQKVEAR